AEDGIRDKLVTGVQTCALPILVNMGLGEATSNVKIIDTGADELARISGQRPVTRRAKKSIAAFKVRKGMPIGTMVTLRGERMWEIGRAACRGRVVGVVVGALLG